MVGHDSDATSWLDQRVAWISAFLFPGLMIMAVLLLHAWWAGWLLPLALVPVFLVWFRRPARRTLVLRSSLMFSLAGVVLMVTLVNLLVLRAGTAPHRYIHDGAVQTEDAVRFLARGVNPYSADYRQSPFGAFIDDFSHGVRPNPAWTHHVYLPFHFLSSLPLLALSEQVSGWYDQRVMYVLAEILALVFIVRIARGGEWKLLSAMLFLLNPFWVKFFVQGYNDIFVFALMAGVVWALSDRRWSLAGIFYGLAVASKQSAWLFAPFFLAYLVWRNPNGRKDWFQPVLLAVASAAACLLPFLVWDFWGFVDDVYRYPAGSLETSYPISGFGLSSLFLDAGIIKSMWDYYPFSYWQVGIGLPFLITLLFFQKQGNTLVRLVVTSMVFTFIFWFLSRFFNWNYVSYLSFFAITALALAGPAAVFIRKRV